MSLTAIIFGAVVFALVVSRVWVERDRSARERANPVAASIHGPDDPSPRAVERAAKRGTAHDGTRPGPLDNLPSGPRRTPRRASTVARNVLATVSTSVAVFVLLVASVAIEAAPNLEIFAGAVIVCIGAIALKIAFWPDEHNDHGDETAVALAPGELLEPPPPATTLAVDDWSATRGPRSGPVTVDHLLFRISTPRRVSRTHMPRRTNR